MTKFLVTPDNPRVSFRELAGGLLGVVGLTVTATLLGATPAAGLLGAVVLLCLYVVWRQRRSQARARDHVT
jgi:hypothetical protein